MRQGRFEFGDEEIQTQSQEVAGRMTPASVEHVLQLMAECVRAVARGMATQTTGATVDEPTGATEAQHSGGQR
ncbi:MAG: hypothetical protein ACOYOB_19895 [Myxococcota bacterium]